MGPDATILVFSMLSFKPALLSPSATGPLVLLHCLPIRLVSSAYLRLLIFFPAVLISAWASSIPAFCMMYPVYKLISRVTVHSLTYSFPNLEPVCCSMSSSNCCFLTHLQISQEAGQVVWYSLLFKNFPQFVVIHTVKGFSLVNEAKVDVFLEFPCFFYHPRNVCSLISGSSAFFKFSLYIC